MSSAGCVACPGPIPRTMSHRWLMVAGTRPGRLTSGATAPGANDRHAQPVRNPGRAPGEPVLVIPPAVLLAAALTLAALIPAVRAPAPPMPGPCAEWGPTALAAGWPAEEWPTVARVMECESGCQPRAYNRSGASGLMQVLKRWAPELDLFDPATNLAVALDVWHRQGWQAWSCW